MFIYCRHNFTDVTLRSEQRKRELLFSNLYQDTGYPNDPSRPPHSWPPTAAARVRVRVWSCNAEAGFVRVLRFPLPVFIPPISPQSPSSIIWGWYNRPVLAAVPSGLSLTPLRIIMKESDLRGFPQSVHVNPEIVTRIYHDRFLPNLLQFLIHS
jgi:hypothetical protein